MLRWLMWRSGLAIGKAVKAVGSRLLDAGWAMTDGAGRLWDRKWCGGKFWERHEFTYWLHDPGFGTWDHTCTKCGHGELVKERPADFTD